MKYALAILALLLLASCRKEEMQSQPKNLPLEPSDFFADGSSARPLVTGTVPRQSTADTYGLAQPVHSVYAANFPEDFPTSGDALRLKLLRGQERYDIYCAICHGALGNGDGMVARRGFVPPSSFHNDTLRTAPPGRIYDAITYGKGAMYSYSSRIAPDDRWAIVAYIRALQLSQNAALTDLPEQDQQQIRRTAP